MLLTIITFSLGIAATWYFAFVYYKRSSREMPEWIGSEFVSEIKAILVKDPSNVDWTADQIVRLYRSKVFNGASTPTIYDVRFCPSCGSKRIRLIYIKYLYLHDYDLECRDCHWTFSGPCTDDVTPTQLELLKTRFGGVEYVERK